MPLLNGFTGNNMSCRSALSFSFNIAYIDLVYLLASAMGVDLALSCRLPFLEMPTYYIATSFMTKHMFIWFCFISLWYQSFRTYQFHMRLMPNWCVENDPTLILVLRVFQYTSYFNVCFTMRIQLVHRKLVFFGAVSGVFQGSCFARIQRICCAFGKGAKLSSTLNDINT